MSCTDKLYEYQGLLGRVHQARDELRQRWASFHETFKVKYFQHGAEPYENYEHVFRQKTRAELIRISAAVMGIEFSYSAETAFVSPTLLKIGVEHQHMTLVWALSPLIGFFLTPILGSLSDRCPLKFGRRRPFILLLSLGVFIGLLLVPNGEFLGSLMGDINVSNIQTLNGTLTEESINSSHQRDNERSWAVFFTILGTVLLDFDADACQSPARTYLLDVTISDDHAKGLSTFTIMAGIGGFLGYALGGINWDATTIGNLFGGHVRTVFSLTTIIFVICVSYTLTSFKEVPLQVIETQLPLSGYASSYGSVESLCSESDDSVIKTAKRRKSIVPSPDASLLLYLKSIVYMPRSLMVLCITNLFCWMAHVCYSLYFTDFVGEAVFGGDPQGDSNSAERELYEEGVRFGCWGMSMYSLSCACYSFIIASLINRFGAKKVYVGGLLTYSIGMCLMALTKHKFGVIIFSWSAGVMYSTLFTLPYLLVADYHAKGTFDTNQEHSGPGQIRGLGTDVAIVSSMVFLAQFILSTCMGYIVNATGTTTAVVSVASALAFCGAISATHVVYLDV